MVRPHSPEQVSRADLVRQLREQVRRLEGEQSQAEEEAVTTGCGALDRLLPHGGLRRGALVEWLATEAGSGAASLALVAGREACRRRGALVVVDRRGEFYPSAAAAWGVPLEQVVLIMPQKEADALWALEQALRCRGVAAVWGEVPRLDVTWQRRLQLAAEAGGTVGLFLRPGEIRGRPSWADVQIWVEPQPSAPETGRRLRVEVLRCRGGTGGRAAEIEIDDPTGVMHLASDRHEPHPLPAFADLAPATVPRRSSGA